MNCAEFENETAHLVSPYSVMILRRSMSAKYEAVGHRDYGIAYLAMSARAYYSRIRDKKRTLYILTRRIWGNIGVGGRIGQGLPFVVIKRATYIRQLEDKARANSYAATIIIKEGPMIAHSGTISRRRLLLSQERGFIVPGLPKVTPEFFSSGVALSSQGKAVIISTS